MSHDCTELINLLSRRREAYKALAAEIAAGQQACIALDLEGVQLHDREKALLCGELHRLDVAITNLDAGRNLSWLAEGGGQPDEKRQTVLRVRELVRDSEAARAEAGRRNQVYAGFLKRAAATGRVMMNILSHCAGVYPASVGGADSVFGRGR